MFDKCVMCDSGKVRKANVKWQVTVDGTRFFAKLPGLVCDNCKEEYIDAPVLGRFEVRVAFELAHRGKMSAEAFRFMRTAIGLPSKDLAKMLGVKPETISRWEHGKRELDRCAFALLGGLVCEHVKDCPVPISGLLKAIGKPTKEQSVLLKVA
jgi:putative zinc finger/helix-turn-helix YgiT family protein